ncbi:fibronectin type III domain-containing protein [Luteolibacter marinus]|uniref:fibronectin type III domain-containing protein n=1 Tax=Luteolibacter marinus TaxID=2776705 RepID=UPI001866ECC8|nr:hypothetical protein [Luteolibacter marinus]
MRLFFLSLLAITALPASAALTSPANVQAVASSSTTVTVTWNAVTGAEGYIVLRDNTQQGGATTNTSFNDTGLTPGTAYSYTVIAASIVDGNSEPSVAATVTTPQAPGTPTGLRGSATSGGVVLNWNAVSGADEYFVYRDGTEIGNPSGTTFTDSDVEASTTYKYSVSAGSGGEESDESAEISVTTQGDGSQREAVWSREFRRADGDYDEIVTMEEYLIAFPNKLAWTIMRNRFIESDDDGSLDLTVDEYINHFAGRKVKRPSKAQTFYLADTAEFDRLDPDEEGDGLLSEEEFALTLNRGTPGAKVTKKFDKLDKNGSTQLSEAEFKIRGGASEDE